MEPELSRPNHYFECRIFILLWERWDSLCTFPLSSPFQISFQTWNRTFLHIVRPISVVFLVAIKYYKFKKNLILSYYSSSSSPLLDFRENGSRGVGLVITGSEYLFRRVRPGGRQTPQVARRATPRRPQAAGGCFLSIFPHKFMGMNFFWGPGFFWTLFLDSPRVHATFFQIFRIFLHIFKARSNMKHAKNLKFFL